VARAPDEAVRYLWTTRAIRERCGNVLARGLEGRLTHFAVDMDALPEVVTRVAALTKERFPDLRVPPHSRWGHFRAGGVDRAAKLWKLLAARPPEEHARAGFDLVVTSVLLDAGAGPDWRYREDGQGSPQASAVHPGGVRAEGAGGPRSATQESESGETFARSEGLAVASFDAFTRGLFSSDAGEPLRADAAALASLDEDALARAFQVRDGNHLVGLEGRAALMRSLGDAVRARPDLFGDEGRVGGLFDHLRGRADGGRLPAHAILDAVLEGLHPIWPGRISLGGVSLGDVWQHPYAGGEGHGAGLVPFHKLSQWLSYSLIEPLEASGVEVVELDALTGLAEYRNGGLFVDAGVLLPKEPEVVRAMHPPSSEVVVEWRALTVALLDRVADGVRASFGKSPADMPLAHVLEGGTWDAGRAIAKERRPDGGPPIRIQSDGTVF
jgi:hypothetical protein